MTTTELCVATFVVTALWDVMLRAMSLRWDELPGPVRSAMPFIGYLTDYFRQHTLLAAALIAGFVGATTQWLILTFVARWPRTAGAVPAFLVASFVVSALYGFVMKFSGLFPVLERTYYRRLEQDGGVSRSMLHDGVSGLIVQVTLLILTHSTSRWR